MTWDADHEAMRELRQAEGVGNSRDMSSPSWILVKRSWVDVSDHIGSINFGFCYVKLVGVSCNVIWCYRFLLGDGMIVAKHL